MRIITQPQPISSVDNSNNDYVFAVCKCPVLMDHGIIIDKRIHKSDNGVYKFKCEKCGLEGEVVTGSCIASEWLRDIKIEE